MAFNDSSGSEEIQSIDGRSPRRRPALVRPPHVLLPGDFARAPNERGTDALRDELAIVWLIDRTLPKFRYVRETFDEFCRRRQRRPRWHRHRRGVLVGYSVLHATARSRIPECFARRLFWVDPACDPYGGIDGRGIPCEGVCPLSVEAGRWGLCTARAAGEPVTDVPPGLDALVALLTADVGGER